MSVKVSSDESNSSDECVFEVSSDESNSSDECVFDVSSDGQLMFRLMAN